mgnify:CR=1 FL=1
MESYEIRHRFQKKISKRQTILLVIELDKQTNLIFILLACAFSENIMIIIDFDKETYLG